MSYTPHTWIDGETITAAKMNAIEEGIEDAAESGGDGYDAILRYDAGDGYSIVKGTFAETLAMMRDGVCPKILYETYGSSGDNDITTRTMVVDYVNWYGSRGWLHLEAHVGTSTEYIGWKENGEVFYDD